MSRGRDVKRDFNEEIGGFESSQPFGLTTETPFFEAEKQKVARKKNLLRKYTKLRTF